MLCSICLFTLCSLNILVYARGKWRENFLWITDIEGSDAWNVDFAMTAVSNCRTFASTENVIIFKNTRADHVYNCSGITFCWQIPNKDTTLLYTCTYM